MGVDDIAAEVVDNINPALTAGGGGGGGGGVAPGPPPGVAEMATVSHMENERIVLY